MQRDHDPNLLACTIDVPFPGHAAVAGEDVVLLGCSIAVYREACRVNLVPRGHRHRCHNN